MPNRVKIETTSGVTVEVDADLVKRFEELPPGSDSRVGHQWTDEEDALLLKYWPVKNHQEIARILNVSATTALKRYRKLTRAG